MIGKKIGEFADVRFKEPKWYGANFDPGGIDHISKEMSLKITGGDSVTLNRKYRAAWQGRLPMKMRLISNIIPYLNDPILPSRFIKIAYNVSFRDREDIEMIGKLKAELPGIANRCLRAYRRLCQRGHFIQPESGLRLAKKLAARSNAFQAFVDECCVIGEQGASMRCEKLYAKFQEWCQDNGQLDALRSTPQSHHLGRHLRKQVRGLESLKLFRAGANQPREYVGIRLKTKVDLDVEDGVQIIEPLKVVGGFHRRI